MKICLVNTWDGRGGAAAVCRSLHREFLLGGFDSRLVVGRRVQDEPHTLLLHEDRAVSGWWKLLVGGPGAATLAGAYFSRVWDVAKPRLRVVASPSRLLDALRGREDFDYPATRHLLERMPFEIDILHCHNLHGGYFDLRALPELSLRVPIVITLHDLWLLTGHCAQPIGCLRWQKGCGDCPDLGSPYPIRNDATRRNWGVKEEVYSMSRIHIIAPSAWALASAQESMLWKSVGLSRVIPNGVDASVFCPGDKRAARETLGLPQDSSVLMLSANGIRKSHFRDYRMMVSVVRRLSALSSAEKLVVLAVGEDGGTDFEAGVEIRFVSHIDSPEYLAVHYRAADVFVHPSRADTFPNVVIESLACGTPVVATAVGGIPEQIDDWETGALVSPGNHLAMADAIDALLRNPATLRRMSLCAAERAKRNFSLDRMVTDHLAFYNEIAADWRGAE